MSFSSLLLCTSSQLRLFALARLSSAPLPRPHAGSWSAPVSQVSLHKTGLLDLVTRGQLSMRCRVLTCSGVSADCCSLSVPSTDAVPCASFLFTSIRSFDSTHLILPKADRSTSTHRASDNALPLSSNRATPTTGSALNNLLVAPLALTVPLYIRLSPPFSIPIRSCSSDTPWP